VKFHDLLSLRQTTNGMNGWKSHVSTSERIKIDRKNFELKLFLLDSLPKEIMKETLQMVCRELDVSDISEIRESLLKLKTVIRMVPRMQKFIEKTSSFVISRNKAFEKEISIDEQYLHHPSFPMTNESADGDENERLESIHPILQRWWKTMQHYLMFKGFIDKLLFEFFRREEITTLASRTHMQPSLILTSSHVYNEDTLRIKFRKQQLDRKSDYTDAKVPVLIEQVRELVDLQLEILHLNPSTIGIDAYIQSRPDIFLNGVVNHVRYLFKIHDVQEIVPKLNELYLFHDEINSFLNSLKKLMDPQNQQISLRKLMAETLFQLKNALTA